MSPFVRSRPSIAFYALILLALVLPGVPRAAPGPQAPAAASERRLARDGTSGARRGLARPALDALHALVSGTRVGVDRVRVSPLKNGGEVIRM